VPELSHSFRQSDSEAPLLSLIFLDKAPRRNPGVWGTLQRPIAIVSKYVFDWLYCWLQPMQKSPTIKAAYITGFFFVIAAIIGACKLSFSDKPKTDGLLITGIVVESDDNKEIGQALVTVVGHPEQATTRDNGNFRIVMPVGSPDVVTLRVTKSGYKTHDEDVHIPTEGLTVQVRKQ
jgi:hypothetical protein